ncbi:MAG: GAF domain-containing protein [Candidatus Omnitrophica bacterium]|nr:GAF domain-containing protein [Candidatus Omnitrophota bacterium]
MVNDQTLFAIPVFITGTILALGIGFVVYLKDPRSIRNFSFFLVCASTGLWLITVPAVYLAPNPIVAAEWYKKVTFLGVAFIAPSIFFFSTTLFKDRKPWIQWTRLVYFIALVFYLLGLIGDWGVLRAERFPWGYYPKYGHSNGIFFSYFVVCYTAALINIARSIRLEENEVRRIQDKIFFAAFSITFFGVVDFITKLTPLVVYPFGYLPIAVWIMIVAYAIIRYRALDVQTVIHKTIMWMTLSAVALFPLVLLVYATQSWYQRLSPLIFSIVMLPVCALFTLYLRWIQPRIDRLFNRRKVDLEAELDRFTAELVTLKNPKEVVDKVMDTAQRVFDLESITLFLVNDGRAQLAVVKRQGRLAVDEGTRYSVDHPLMVWLANHDRIIDWRFLEIDPQYRSMPVEGRELLPSLKAAYLVPLVLNQSLVGIILLGDKKDGAFFKEIEAHFLNRFRAQGAIALSNSLLYGKVEQEVQRRTEELLETKDQLTRAEKLATLGTLAGGVAHEINNPLTAILTNIQMMAMDPHDESEKESLVLMEEATKRCRTIVQKLMTYARQSPGRKKEEAIDLITVVQNTVELLRYQIQQDNIEINVEINGINDAMIRGNSGELEQVLTNLILNARDAVKSVERSSRGIEISLSQDSSLFLLKVKDNGCGIPSHVLPRIFDPFFTTKDVGKGTGLGLSICQSIVEQHGGRIIAQSKVGEGTEMKVELPRREVMPK